jgi:inosine-uridine nucleoside N-ribohydrolase
MNIVPEDVSADQLRTSSRGYRVRSAWMRDLLTFLMVFDPGLIDRQAALVSIVAVSRTVGSVLRAWFIHQADISRYSCKPRSLGVKL